MTELQHNQNVDHMAEWQFSMGYQQDGMYVAPVYLSCGGKSTEKKKTSQNNVLGIQKD